MEQSVLVPASVYNKRLITHSVTKQELLKYQPSKNPTYQGNSLKKKTNKKLFSKADSLKEKILFCPRIKLSISQTFILDGVETGISFLEFVQQLHRKNKAVPDIYFSFLTPLVYLRLWFWIRMLKLKREEVGSLSKSERQKLQRLYTQGGTAFGSVGNLVRSSNLSESKVRQFLQSKPSYTKFTPATRKFKRMKTFARLENEICCMDLAYVDKLAEDNNGIKYLLVRQDLFGRLVDAKVMKRKDSKETVRALLSMITKKNRPKKFWVDKGTEFAGEFKNLCKAEGIQIYSTMSEIKAAFAERTIRSLKNIHYRYMEGNAYKYIHKLTQIVLALNSWRNCSLDLTPKKVKNSDFLSILYSKPVREFRKPKFKVGDRVRISKYDLHFRKGYKLKFTNEAYNFFQKTSNKHNKGWTKWDYPR